MTQELTANFGFPAPGLGDQGQESLAAYNAALAAADAALAAALAGKLATNAWGFPLPIMANTNNNPADSTTYYFGQLASWFATTATYRKIMVPWPGVVRVCSLNWACAAGSNEAVVFYVRKNDTTDYLLADDVDMSAVAGNIFKTDLNIPVVQGDFLHIKMVTPAWATNPTALAFGGTIFVQGV